MLLLSPLFKVFNNDILIGGGVKISKPPITITTNYRASSELRVNNKVVVTYDNATPDRYGVEITDITLVQHDETQVDVSIVGYDNFVNNVNVDTSSSLKCSVVAIRQDHENTKYNLNQRPTIMLLESLGKEVPLSLLGSTLVHPVRSTGVRNDANDNRSVVNQSRIFRETSFKQSIESHSHNHDEYVDVATKQTFPIYGPHKYDVIVILNDKNITFASIKRSLFVHGVYDVMVEPARTGGVRTGVNLNDSVRVTWKLSTGNELVPETSIVELRDNDGNLLVTVPPATTADGTVVVAMSSLLTGSYRGTVRGYVQYKHVHWSPLNYSNVIVFETSNEPTTVEFFVSNDEKKHGSVGYDQLYIQLVTLDTITGSANASLLERVVTLRLYEDEARTIQRTTVVFTRLYEAHVVSNLETATAYYASYDINDFLNPVYSADVIDARYSTRTDPATLVAEDIDGPEIELTLNVTGTSFTARITDASYIVNVRYSLNADLEMNRVTTYQQWTNVNIEELSKEVVTHQEIFVFYKDDTNVNPFLVSAAASDHNTTSFKLFVESTDILNNKTLQVRTILLN